MGWKGTVRQIGAAVRTAERESRRRQRELEKRQKQYEKMEELDQALFEVEIFENKIELLKSVHKDCNEHIDWISISASPKPKEPIKLTTNENLAKSKLENYKPGILDKIFKREFKKIEKLKLQIKDCINKDEFEYKNNIETYNLLVKDWEESTSLARRLISGDQHAKLESIKELNPFAELSSFGSSINISINSEGQVDATIKVYGDNIIPREIKSLLKNGKLSVKQMSKGMFNEIHQDYVCGCVLRVANEIFAAIPDEFILVTAVDKLLNSKTGHMEETPILSAYISRRTLKSLCLDAIDTSDAMSNFLHNMSFKKTIGFSPIPRIELNKE